MRHALWVTLWVVASCARRATPPAQTFQASVPPAAQSGFADADVLPAKMDGLALPPAPGDRTGELFSKRLDFRAGAPVLPIRLMEGRTEVSFSARGRMRMKLSGEVEKTVEAPAGSTWTVRLVEGSPATLSARVQLAEFPFADKEGLAAEERRWVEKGLLVKTHVLGSVYGISGKVVDSRRYLLLDDAPTSRAEAVQRQAELLRTHGVRTMLFEEVKTPPRGILELRDPSGVVVALAQDLLVAETLDGAPFDVRAVEHDVGYANHGFDDRSYRGSLELTVDRQGKLAVVNLVPMEELLKGLVPAEIFARAHPEALKAQAVTARGEVLAKIGTKHLADPYLLCAEQHCAVYKGLLGEAVSTNAAVEATRGEGLFDASGRLVDSVYSAVCGGHTEHNDIVWGGPPNPSLRGRPDTLPGRRALSAPGKLEAFLVAELPAACRLSSFAQPSKYRWERRFTAEEVNRLTEPLGIGPVRAIAVTDRGVSGRARLVTLSGENGATQIRGELNIRRLFGMLNSAMFIVSPQLGPDGKPTAWLFRGGGWGHGVGMCQTGAIGRAEAGQDYRAILEHYFNGAQVARIY
ncbi:MAG: SpoIID/LytB domain-containing protein [Myxococcota bacterium]